jgi:hypothetical protein
MTQQNQPVSLRCTDPECPDYGSPDFGEGTCPQEHASLLRDTDVVDDEFGYYPSDDDPWAGRPVAKMTFRQRWLSGPVCLKVIYRLSGNRHVTISADLRSWKVGFASYFYGGGEVQAGPVSVTISEPPF